LVPIGLDRDLDLGREDLNALELSLDRARLGSSLHDFIEEFWSVVEPGINFQTNWHVRLICGDLEQAYRDWRANKSVRRIYNIPPGTMKSLLWVFFNAWCWTKLGRMRFLTFSYGAHLTTRDNLRVRAIVMSRRYQELWPLGFAEDQDTKTRYNTDQGGWRIATSVGGVGTGEHPDCIVIDDAATALEAKSDTERKRINGWYSATIPSRGKSRNAMIFVLGQRLDEEDLPGYLIAQGGWVVTRLPMRYEKCTCTASERCALHLAEPSWRPDPRDPRTAPGELMWPALFDEKKVQELEKELLEDAPGQLQQRPSRVGGGLIKRENFKYVSAPPAQRLAARGWDTAASEGRGDWTAGVLISEGLELRGDPRYPKLAPQLMRTGTYYVENVRREQLGPDGVDRLMLTTAQDDGKPVAQREQREGGASGKHVITARARLLTGHDYAEVHVGVNKVLFSKPFRAQVAAGNVYVVKTGDPARDAWIELFLAEMAAFTATGAHKHDDQVDAASTAFNSLPELELPSTMGAVW
jgi:predicted phage terminase large subunit-like protein